MAKRTANIAAQLEAARIELADLEAAAPRLAHDAAVHEGEPERQKYREARAKIAELRDRIAMLESAERHAREQADQRERMRKEAERDAIKARCLKLSLNRIEIVEKLSEQIAAVMETYHELQKSTQAIVAAAPVHYPTPPFLMLGVGELQVATNLEVIRADKRPVDKDSDAAWTFPRADHGATITMKAKPSTIQPMAEVFRGAHNALAIELEKQFFSPPGSMDMAPDAVEARPAIAEAAVTSAVAGQAEADADR